MTENSIKNVYTKYNRFQDDFSSESEYIYFGDASEADSDHSNSSDIDLVIYFSKNLIKIFVAFEYLCRINKLIHLWKKKQLTNLLISAFHWKFDEYLILIQTWRLNGRFLGYTSLLKVVQFLISFRMVYNMTIFEKKIFSLTGSYDVIPYLGNGALTKKWYFGFRKPLTWLFIWRNKNINYPRCQMAGLFSLSMWYILIWDNSFIF